MPQHETPAETADLSEFDEICDDEQTGSDLKHKHKHKPWPCPPHPHPHPPMTQNCICSCICQFLEIPGIDHIIEAEFKVVEVKHVHIDCMKCVKLVFRITIRFINCAGQTVVFSETFTRIFCDFPEPCSKRPPIAIFCNPPAFDFNSDGTFVIKTIVKICC